MPLYKSYPEPSGRMGLLWTLGLIKDAAILEFGSMGHMIYAEKWMSQTGMPKRSKLYATHLDEKDIALGITKRLENAVKEIAEQEEIKAIFLLPSSVPEMIGMDIGAMCEELQETISTPLIPLGAGNFKATKGDGIEEALYQLVKHFPERGKGKYKSRLDETNGEDEKPEEEIDGEDETSRACEANKKRSFRCNIIGSICDAARFFSDAKELERIVKGAFGMEVISTLTSDTSIEDIRSMGKADINIVIRKEGIKAAKVLEERLGTTYLPEAPYGYQGTLEWIKKLSDLLGIEEDQTFLKKEMEEGNYTLNSCKLWAGLRKDKAKIWFEGNEDFAKGMKLFAVRELGFALEQGGILMSNRKKVKAEKHIHGIEIERTTDSSNYNIYESPFMGFRGAMNLCSLWIEYLIKK